jgi:hypothetical protein
MTSSHYRWWACYVCQYHQFTLRDFLAARGYIDILLRNYQKAPTDSAFEVYQYIGEPTAPMQGSISFDNNLTLIA